MATGPLFWRVLTGSNVNTSFFRDMARSIYTIRNLCAVSRRHSNVCIVGAGPAGFYAAQHLAKHTPDVVIDIIEKLPTPFGLVRYGVAPDHPEVKNVINTFTKTALRTNVNFYGNISLGSDVTLAELRQHYHIVLLTYGAERDRLLGIENEDLENVLSARKFVGWYNGTPGDQNLKVDLSGNTVAIFGQGNVAMDVARILLTPIDVLRKTDITEHALATLADSKVRNVYLVGRRGPLQAAFTIKELREQIKLPQCQTVWRESDFDTIQAIAEQLPRPKKRICELMLKSMRELSESVSSPDWNRFFPLFCRSPIRFIADGMGRLSGVELSCNKLSGDDILNQQCSPSLDKERLECNLALRSIGYKSISVDKDINFDSNNGLVFNSNGRVVLANDATPDWGLYVAGWLRTGPMGVILTTMTNAFEVASIIGKDLADHPEKLHSNENKIGFQPLREILEKRNIQIVDWEGWEKIDRYETEKGAKVGKPREKLCDVAKMLEISSR